MKPLFSIGTKFRTRHKNPRDCEVVDIYRTYDSAGNLVKIRYVVVYFVLGQKVIDSDVVETTIVRGKQDDVYTS